MATSDTVFAIENYSLSLKDSEGAVLPILENISLSIEKGKCLGIAGESGSGKSVLVSSALGLIPDSSISEKTGVAYFCGKEINKVLLSNIMGKDIGFVFQEPMTAMNPIMTLYDQISETVETHLPELSSEEIRKKVITALNKAGFIEPEKFLNSYPHQLSGGMRQRAMIAMAIVMEPALIIADEPTTAIDAELQVQILSELRCKINSSDCGMIFISHDLGVMRSISDELAILYSGCLVEKGFTDKVLSNPKHPYTKALINSLPRLIAQRKIPEPIDGNMPAPNNKPEGCVFAPRCRFAKEMCYKTRPVLRQVDENRYVACNFDL